ncbi:MAG TPA: response regulator transcription factor [Firmicutes bacterium]|nr:response regulator transcription factor [Bacillota bacterium]
MYKILIAEDDETIYAELARLFGNACYEVVDGRDGIRSDDFDVALLDIGLPGTSGYELCSAIKARRNVPVVFLTAAERTESELTGFAVGGDDYVRKPFDPAVLLARVRRLLRRADTVIVHGRLKLDTARMEAVSGDKRATLSRTEFAVLRLLTEGGVVSQKKLIERLWDGGSYIDENTLYVSINRLREKLRDIGMDGAVVTVRGVGYRLE